MRRTTTAGKVLSQSSQSLPHRPTPSHPQQPPSQRLSPPVTTAISNRDTAVSPAVTTTCSRRLGPWCPGTGTLDAVPRPVSHSHRPRPPARHASRIPRHGGRRRRVRGTGSPSHSSRDAPACCFLPAGRSVSPTCPPACRSRRCPCTVLPFSLPRPHNRRPSVVSPPSSAHLGNPTAAFQLLLDRPPRSAQI